jgi:UPF0755 protein
MKKTANLRQEIYFFTVSLVFLSIMIGYLSFFMPISSEGQWKEIRIPQGTSYSRGIAILREQGVIKNRFIFLILGRLTKLEKRLQSGYYNLNTSMSPLEVFNRLRKGMIVHYTIVIPEGVPLDVIGEKLFHTGLVNDESWNLISDKNFLSSLNIYAPSLEGYLYPDTYNFAKGAEPKDIFKRMVQRLRENFDQSLVSRAEELGMSEREVLTLASIIENEALYDRERALISAVYHNRLKKNMHLQADPTVVYGIKRMQDGITRRDLRRSTPYNTYIIEGLPPGPISSPGIKSIRAALYPADVDYLYFVSKNDGTHYFSTTGEEHLKAVMVYQRKKQNPASPDETVNDQSEKIKEKKEHDITEKEEKTNQAD